MRGKNRNNNKLMCKKCGLIVKADDPLLKGQLEEQNNSNSDKQLEEEGNQNKEGEENEEEEEEVPFVWPKERDETLSRLLPPVTDEHRARMNRLRFDHDSTSENSEKVFQVMLSLDFGTFYDNITYEWIEHNYILLERTSEVVKEGDHVLVFPYNTYFAVALALLLGPTGAVMCYGHLQNSYTLKKYGLEWLMKDHRVKFRNECDALYYAVPLDELTDVVREQLSEEEGVVFRPDTGDFLYRNHSGM